MSTSFNRVDLNLLRVFDAVMDERSVLRASQRICLSQSAVSHALSRLREMLGDELFIRTTSGMQPTARAVSMAPMIREAWKSLEAAIGTHTFDPARSNKRFTIAVNDFVATVMVPNLMQLLGSESPLIELVIVPDTRTDLVEQIDLGQVDAAIGTFLEIPARFRAGSLFAYDDVLVASSSRNFGKISPEALSRLRVAAVSLHGERQGVVNGFVSQNGLSQRSEMYNRAALVKALSAYTDSSPAVISMPHFLALPALLEHTDITAIVPRPLAPSLTGTRQLSIYELPYNPPPVEVSVLWHERTSKEPSHVWFREMVQRAAEPLRRSYERLNEAAGSASTRVTMISGRLISPTSSRVSDGGDGKSEAKSKNVVSNALHVH